VHFLRNRGLKAPAYRLYEDEFSLTILEINPFTPGHCLVVSKRHTRWWHDLTEEEIKSEGAQELPGRIGPVKRKKALQETARLLKKIKK
jgi:diadenosine tetraphosphate (Ap4A) HIT family hydrolase